MIRGNSSHSTIKIAKYPTISTTFRQNSAIHKAIYYSFIHYIVLAGQGNAISLSHFVVFSQIRHFLDMPAVFERVPLSVRKAKRIIPASIAFTFMHKFPAVKNLRRDYFEFLSMLVAYRFLCNFNCVQRKSLTVGCRG